MPKIVTSVVAAVIVAVVLIAAVLFIPGLGLFSSSGTLAVQLTDPPTVPPGVTAVYMSYSKVAVHVSNAGNQSGWYQIAPAGSIDLMQIQSESITLGSASVSTGVYNAIGFNITSATVTANGVNASALVANNHLIIPIVGGIKVNSSSSAGLLVDLSPTVIGVHNETSGATLYILLPEAHSFHIPPSAWSKSMEKRGATISDLLRQQWYAEAAGNISISGPAISSGSFNVTVTNKGNTNAFISSVAIRYPVTNLCSQLPLYTGCSTSSITFPIAFFRVLANATLLQYNLTAVAQAYYSGQLSASTVSAQLRAIYGVQGVLDGLVIAPHSSVTLSFKGQVATISSSILDYVPASVASSTTLLASLSQINIGQTYLVVVRGPFFTMARANVTAIA